eukprot:372296-Amphidinium_carterae.3
MTEGEGRHREIGVPHHLEEILGESHNHRGPQIEEDSRGEVHQDPGTDVHLRETVPGAQDNRRGGRLEIVRHRGH